MADTFRLARSAFIKAPPEIIHALVNDFHQWEQWSPWVKMDAGHLSQTYEGPSSGVGSGYTWSGPKTGKGRMEILTSMPAHIGISLDFIAPMKRSNKADFTFTPEDGGTKVEWAMTGPMGLFDKIMQIFFSMEKMVGPSFEQGLAGIKTLAESTAPKAAPAPKPTPAAAPPKAAAAAPKAAAPKAAPKPVAPKAPTTPKAAAPKPAPKPVAAKPKPLAKAPAPKAKPASASKPVAVKPATPKTKPAPAKPAAAKAKPAVKAPVAKAPAKPAPKPAAAKKPVAKAKPAAKPKAPASKA